MKKIINLLVLLIAYNAFSQSNFNTTNLEVTKGDLEQNEYPQDSTAKAIVIYEKGNSYIHPETYKLITEIEKKVKILSKDGAQHADIEILLYKNEKKSRREKVSKIEAKSYNLSNNRIITSILNKKDIFNEDYSENYTIVKFTLPKIKKGTVITYKYTLESPFIFKYKEWEFQDDIPKLYSQYNTSIPGVYDYNIKLVGTLKLSINEATLKRKCLRANNGSTADCVNTIYAMKNVPAFIEEDYMTSKQNYLSRIEYELKTFNDFDGSIDKVTKTWKFADGEIKSMRNIGKQLNKASLVTELLDNSVASISDEITRAKTIFNFTQNNFSWNGKNLTYKPATIKDLINERTGNVSQINIMLYNLLKANDIEVFPVLISTRTNGFVTQLYPVISEFNYLIVQAYIDGKKYLLDATDKYLTFGQLPFRCLNGKGRLMDFKNGSSWIDIIDENVSSVQHQIKLKFSGRDRFEGKINSRYTGYMALSKKLEYYSNSNGYIEDFENKHDDFEVINHEFKSKGKEDELFQESFDITYNELETIGENIYFDPFIYKFFSKNPFNLQQRTYPIEFGYKKSFIYNFEINLGEHYEVSELPKSINMKLPNNAGKLIFASKIAGNKISILFKIDFKQSKYAPEYYPSLKELMNNIVDLQTKTLIVLKKRSE